MSRSPKNNTARMKWLVAFAVILFVNAICIISTTMGNKSPLFLVYDIDKNDVLEFNWEDTSAPDDVIVASSAQEPRSNEVNVANEVLENANTTGDTEVGGNGAKTNAASDSHPLLPYENVETLMTNSKISSSNTDFTKYDVAGHLYPAHRCYQELDAELRPLLLEWYRKGLPILSTVKLLQVKQGMQSYYSIVFIGQGFGHRQHKFLCNGKYEASFDERPTSSLVLKCPPELDPSKEPLTDITFVHKENPEKEPVAHYDTRKALECELLDIKFFSPAPPSTRNNAELTIALGAVAIFAGGEKARKEALQWAEYHHFIGIQHIWLYVNEHWDYKDYENFDKPYISWIPFNHTLRNYPKESFNTSHIRANAKMHQVYMRNLGRLMAMNDALFRAKRMGLEWLLNTDIDEYLFLNEEANSFHDMNNSSSLLVQYMEGFSCTSIEEIELNSIPFGGGTNTTLVIDHDFRKKQDLKDASFSRWKIFANVSSAPSLHIHNIDAGDRRNVLRAPTDQLRINHYKHPDMGVFVGGWRSGGAQGSILGQDKIIQDSTMKDRFHDVLLDTN